MTMRENMGLYRGKHNGTWIEGSLLIDEAGNCYIGTYLKSSKCDSFIAGGGRQCGKTEKRFLGIGFSLVDKETVGQYAGLTDKNGKRIFEGDVVRQTFAKTVPIFTSPWSSEDSEDLLGEDVGAVVIIPSKGVCIKNPVIHREVDGEVTQHGEKARMYKPVCSGRCEVIGNINDDPELLEVSK